MRRHCWPPSRPSFADPAAAEAKAREGARAVAGGFDARRMAEAVTGFYATTLAYRSPAA